MSFPLGQRGRATRGRRPAITGGAPVDLRLLRFTDGTFTRGGEASYQTGANTLAWAASNVLRYEDRGDGNGAVALFEGGSTNLIRDPEDLTAASWDDDGLSTYSEVDAPPDGEDLATRILFADNADLFQDISPSLADNTLYAPSRWIKQVGAAPTTDHAWQLRNKSGTIAINERPAFGSVWERQMYDAFDSLTGASSGRFALRDGGVGGGGTFDIWGCQLEALPFASSYIRNGAARPADVLTFTPAQVPAALKSGRWQFDWYPSYPSTADTLGAGTDCYLFSLPDSSTGLASFESVVYEADNKRLRIYADGAYQVTTPSITFSAGQKITISLDSAAGTLTIAGATGGNGTTTGSLWTFGASLGLTVGSQRGLVVTPQDVDAYSRISEPRAW